MDVVVANAGHRRRRPRALDGPDEWERVIDVNLKGVYRTAHACLPHVIERRGYIVNIASMAAIAHAPMLSAYCATKAGVEAFSNALRTEVAHHGVDVGVAYYSWIDTDMVRGMDDHPAHTALRAPSRDRSPRRRRCRSP